MTRYNRNSLCKNALSDRYPNAVPGRSRAPAAALALGLLAAGAAHAAVLEEVVVTAQLREQSLQDVPVSVSAVTGEKIMEAGIGNIEDMQAYVPNLYMSQATISTDVFIRGIGSGVNQGFEQSVGMYIDGVYYGRSVMARAPFLDLERVEVLRGPQNILMGKNSIAGAVNITTARPADEFGGHLGASYEPVNGERLVDAMVTGPLGEHFGYRLAGRWRESDGYMENLTLDRDEPQRDEYTLRLKLNWAARDDFNAQLKLEHGKFDTVGRQAEVVVADRSESDSDLFAGRTYGEILDRTVYPDAGAGLVLPPAVAAQVGIQPDGAVISFDHDSSVLNNHADHKRHSNHEYSQTDTYNVTLNLDYYRDGHTFTSITGYSAYEFEHLCDCDLTGADLLSAFFFEDFDQFSQELRWISPVGERFEFIGGLYYQQSDFYFFDTILIDSDVLPQLVNAADLLEGGGFGDIDPDPTGSDAFEQAGIGDAGNAIRGLRTPRDFTSDSELWSAFLQGTWNASDSLRLTLGARYTDERKEGSRHTENGLPDGSIQPIGEVDTVVAMVFKGERVDLKGERHERHLSPLVNLQYDVSPEMMLYANATRGFKSGGFDARSNSSPEAELTPANPNAAVPNQTVLIGAFEYEEEEATSYELGTKATLLEGAAEINVALFYTEYDDLQVSIFDGGVGFNVGNAASAVTQGIEIDGRLAISEHLIMAGGLSLLDFEFKEFENGACNQGQQPNSPDGINCDYSGKSNQYAADWSANLMFSYERMLSDSLLFKGNLDFVAIGEYNPTANLDPRMEQDGYVKVNARLGLAGGHGDWEVALVGKNLTDEYVVTYAADVPVAYSVTQAKTYFAHAEPPRTVALQLSLSW